jgi:hypothetical protein
MRNMSPLAAMLLFTGTTTTRTTTTTRSSEEQRRVLEEEERDRAELRRQLSLGLAQNPHPIAVAIRAGDADALRRELMAMAAVTPAPDLADLGLGNTAWHFACYHDRCVDALMGLQRLVRDVMEVRNEEGHTPLDLARQQCQFKLVERLEAMLGVQQRDVFAKRKPFWTPPDLAGTHKPVTSVTCSVQFPSSATTAEQSEQWLPRTEEDIRREREEEEARIVAEREAREAEIRRSKERAREGDDDTTTTTTAAAIADTQFAWLRDHEAALARASESIRELTKF